MLASLLCATVIAPQGSIEPCEGALARVKGKVESLLKEPQPELYARHLRSVVALSEAEVLRLKVAPEQEKLGKEVLGYLKVIETGLNDDGDKAETYLSKGRRSLILARASKLDGSLQWASVSLPKDWDPKREYPLHVGLHGYGPSVPLAYVHFSFLPHGVNDKPARDIVTVVPWGRGNRQWIGDSEADLWEAVEDVQQFTKINPDRWYLSGHSMGADGTWSLVQRTPDRWAAASLMAGSTYAAPPRLGLTPNAAYVPFHIWVGDQDTASGRVASSMEARDTLQALGGTVEFVISKGVGHSPRAGDENAKLEWLLKHTRKRPDHFVFTIDTLQHRGVWGIQVPRTIDSWYPLPEPNQKFEVWIEGKQVRIESHAPKLIVDLGKNGLQMQGEVEVLLNGKSVYKGLADAKPLTLTP